MQGLLLIDKPKDITSFGAVARIKRLAFEKRVGHTGTLDPMATGVLPVLLGRATALSSFMLDSDKEYKATVLLGTVTDTGDITGKILSENDVFVSEDGVDTVLNSFLGRQMQTPPMFSAIKKDGVRLYTLARQGSTVDIPKREIYIHSIKRNSEIRDKSFDISVKVSKGTYIRSLCTDIGEKLGCGATLSKLERTSAVGFDIKDCVSLDSLDGGNISSYLLNEETAVKYMPEIFVTEKQAIRFTNGGALDFERLKNLPEGDNTLLRVKFGDKFLGVGITDCENSCVKIKCVINYL